MHILINQASLGGVVKIILIILTVYVIYSFFVRIVFPTIMRKTVENLQNRFNGDNQQFTQENNRKKEGDISITYVEKEKQSPPNAHAGEYVDYEEIK